MLNDLNLYSLDEVDKGNMFSLKSIVNQVWNKNVKINVQVVDVMLFPHVDVLFLSLYDVCHV